MRWTRKRSLVILLLILGLLALELGREELVYMYVSSNLEHGYWQVKPNMTKEQVLETLGQPDSTAREGGAENWQWEARTHQGWLWRATGLASLKKHYQLTVSFNETDTVADVFGEKK